MILPVWWLKITRGLYFTCGEEKQDRTRVGSASYAREVHSFAA
jgi:hypothetical protein